MTTRQEALKRLNARFQAEMQQLSEAQPVMEIACDPMTLWCVLCSLQLSLRHPLNTGPTSQIVRAFVDQIGAHLAPPGTALADMFALGFDPQHDFVSPETTESEAPDATK